MPFTLMPCTLRMRVFMFAKFDPLPAFTLLYITKLYPSTSNCNTILILEFRVQILALLPLTHAVMEYTCTIIHYSKNACFWGPAVVSKQLSCIQSICI